MSIERLIDSVVHCTLCGKPPGCTCWEAAQAEQRRRGERLLNLLGTTAPVDPDPAPAPRRRGRR